MIIENSSSELTQTMLDIGSRARDASKLLAYASTESKNLALISAAEIMRNRSTDIIAANAKDMDYGRGKKLSDALLDRLMLDEDRIEAIAKALEDVAALEDPIGSVMAEWSQPSGLNIQRVRTPLGVIGVIYESRPNVTADAGGLCLKAGNAAILRGGSESFHSSGMIADCLQQGLQIAGLPKDAIQLVPTRDRAAVGEMLSGLNTSIDVIIPRGGRSLVERVQKEARVPIFAHLEGICHLYLDKSADAEKALSIVLNAKTRRTGICGAAECLLIDRDLDPDIWQKVILALLEHHVEIRGDVEIMKFDSRIIKANQDDFGREFLDMILAARTVEGVEGAIGHIQKYGSDHTESIIAEDQTAVDIFFKRIDSAILMHNASTQFADGGEFGMGAEIGIATGKMHARGPVGVEQLTSFKYLVRADCAIRS